MPDSAKEFNDHDMILLTYAASQEQVRNFTRIEGEVKAIRTDLKELAARVDQLESQRDAATGGINMGRWIASLLPFSAMSAAAGWFIRDR